MWACCSDRSASVHRSATSTRTCSAVPYLVFSTALMLMNTTYDTRYKHGQHSMHRQGIAVGWCNGMSVVAAPLCKPIVHAGLRPSQAARAVCCASHMTLMLMNTTGRTAPPALRPGSIVPMVHSVDISGCYNMLGVAAPVLCRPIAQAVLICTSQQCE